MPVLDGFWFDAPSPTTPVLLARAQESEEAAALPNGERALTPIIAGTISGTCIGIAWLIALIHLIVKRYRRRRRYKQVGEWVGGYLESTKVVEEHKKKQFIAPPDPAVLEAGYKPGERIVVEEKRKWWKRKARASRMRASSSEDWNAGSRSYGAWNEDASGKGKGKGKERERRRPTSPRRYQTASASGSRRHSFSGHPSIRFNRYGSFMNEDEDELETVELRPNSYHRLSAIISAADSQRSLAKSVDSKHSTPPPPVPPKDEPKEEEDTHVGLASPDRDDRSLIREGGSSSRAHKYPPSRSRLR